MSSAVEDSFDLAALDAGLRETRFAGKLHFRPEIPSTNTHAMAEAEAFAADGSVYLADAQTAGRGRGAHSWSSPPGTSLLVSVLLRPALAPADVLWLSLAAGLAARDAIARVAEVRCDLRWPNDLLIGKKKVCGILVELNAEMTRVRHLVIGFGINVRQAEFPPELSEIATSLRIATGRDWPRQALLAALLQSLENEVAALTGPGNLPTATASVLSRVERASTWVRGKRVRVEEMDGYEGVTEGLDPRGFLRIRTAAGLRTVFSGGVREL